VNTAFCWGWDEYGQLGNAGLLFTSSTPIAVDGELRFQQISAGGLHTCGVLTDGRVVCWGANGSGQVGVAGMAQTVGSTPVFDSPRVVALPGGVAAAQVTASHGSHSCALSTNGAAYCWGSNVYGELGTGARSTAAQSAPVAVAGERVFTQLAAGQDFTCGISGGNVYCWGRNSFGQTGNVVDPQRPGLVLPTDVVLTPTPVAQPVNIDASTGLSNPVTVVFTAITAGRRHACARAEDGTLYCWGSDVMGALGSQQQQLVQPRPVRVSRPL
jgi:alpha-tubulin suppressor-like RCC1 family protein